MVLKPPCRLKKRISMTNSDGYRTGWFGIPGGAGSRSTKVHVVKRIPFGRAKPICGSRIGKDQRFQLCCYGVSLEMVECKRCRRMCDD